MTIITIGVDLAKHIFAVPDRLARLLWRTPLGATVSGSRPHRQTHGPEIRHPLPHER